MSEDMVEIIEFYVKKQYQPTPEFYEDFFEEILSVEDEGDVLKVTGIKRKSENFHE